jgi:hypothetical protein
VCTDFVILRAVAESMQEGMIIFFKVNAVALYLGRQDA